MSCWAMDMPRRRRGSSAALAGALAAAARASTRCTKFRPALDALALTYACRAHGGNQHVRLGDHERAHVYQYLVLGPLFLPVYFACGGISHVNRFEQAADRYASTGTGWWPWARPRE